MSGINFCCMHICKGPYRYTHMYASTSVAETAGQAHGRATFLGNYTCNSLTIMKIPQKGVKMICDIYDHY